MKTIITHFSIMLCFAILYTLQSCAQHPEAKSASSTTTNLNSSKIPATENEWKTRLSPEQFSILRLKETEAPFTGKLLYNKDKGVYKCAGCGSELFTDEMKFDSHCGWPSFDREIAGGKIKIAEDNSHGMHRTEIMCAKCGGHLGHLFNDGPTNTGMRYCVNSASLNFESATTAKVASASSIYDTLTLGGGCYWCIEAVYEMLDGVVSVESGFSGGHVADPSYAEVCSGTTGHAEVAQIVYDPKKTNLDEIFKVFFTVHDPTTLNRQGADEGTQYRSVIFYRNNKQYEAAKSVINDLNLHHVYDNPVVTEVAPFKTFYKAEDYHQDYFKANANKPYCKMVIQPKIEKFEKLFKDRLKKKS